VREREVDGAGEGRRPYEKLSAAERALFLDVLRETGNRKAAAGAIGVEARLMDQRRAHDAELDRDWEEAAEAAHRRFAKATGPFDCQQEGPFDPSALLGTSPAQDGPLNMIRRGKRGRLQLVAAGEGRWSGAVEARFLAMLRATGNVRGAAASVGFSESAVWDRRRKWPAFAEAMEEVLEEAELALEFRIAAMASNVVAAGTDDRPSPGPSPAGRGEELPFDMDRAMRFLKWREEKRRGSGRRAPKAKPPPIEEVTEKIVRRVAAIERHRQLQAEKETDDES
jgi:hypothetical protein